MLADLKPRRFFESDASLSKNLLYYLKPEGAVG